MHADVFRCRQPRLDLIVFQKHLIIARLRDFRFVRKTRTVTIVGFGLRSGIVFYFANGRHDQNIAQIGMARAAEMGVAETYNRTVFMLITSTIFINPWLIFSVNVMQNQGIDFNKPVILCTPTARQEYKVWPKEYMKEILSRIIQKYDIQIIFNFSGETERNCAIAYHKEMDDDRHIFTNIEAKSLTELCALTANCDFFFGNEGGPRHIAQALNIPSFAIFPPGIRKGLWLPKESIRFAGISTEDMMPVDEQDKQELTYEERMRLIDVESVWKRFQDVFEQNISI